MEMEEEVREHHHDSIATVGRHRVAKDTLPDLGLGDPVQYGHKRLVNSDSDRNLRCGGRGNRDPGRGLPSWFITPIRRPGT
jgi:hypothetical protein